MGDINIALMNSKKDNACAFRVQMQPILDLREGEWFVALSFVNMNFLIKHKPDNVYITSSIVEHTNFGDGQRQILRYFGKSYSNEFYEEELMYIKAAKGLHNDIAIRLVDEDGHTLETKSANPQTTIRLRLFNIHQKKEEKSYIE